MLILWAAFVCALFANPVLILKIFSVQICSDKFRSVMFCSDKFCSVCSGFVLDVYVSVLVILALVASCLALVAALRPKWTTQIPRG